MEKSTFPIKCKFKQKKKHHLRKQKHPQKKKYGNNENQYFTNNNRTSDFKTIQARARDVASIIKKGKLTNLPAILDKAVKTVTQEEKNAMKEVMGKRYNYQTKALDLTKFGNDEYLNRKGLKIQLFRQPYLTVAADLIVENIPDLEALNLNENNLNIINRLQVLERLANLKIIYLAKNNIAMMSSLDIFKKLPIVELCLEGNPFVEDFKDHSDYVTEVKKYFPKLLKLDGKFLEPSISFDLVEEKTELPPWKKLFLCNSSAQEIVSKFVQQYFAIYDSDDRQQLLEAYHDNALLSITATTSQNFTQKEILTAYHRVSRNLLHQKMIKEIKQSSMKRGKVSVVALLNELPPTKHDPQSFAVDLTFFTQQMIVLTITGIFKERNSSPKCEYVRAFQKTLTIVPNTLGGLSIRNELLHINNATPIQSKKAFKTLIIPKPELLAISNQVEQFNEQTKIQMIQALSQQTNMNLEWSKKCLEETNFDFNRALFAFNELFKLNRIPQEAFSKHEL